MEAQYYFVGARQTGRGGAPRETSLGGRTRHDHIAELSQQEVRLRLGELSAELRTRAATFARELRARAWYGARVIRWALRDARRLFDKQTVTQEWFARRPVFRPNIIMAAVNTITGISGGHTRPRLDVAEGAGLEARLESLTKEVALLYDEVGSLTNKFTAKTEELLRALETEANQRESATRKLRANSK